MGARPFGTLEAGRTRPKGRIEPSLYVAPLALLAHSMAELSTPLTSQARFRVNKCDF
jgi:hypothetical protein